MPRERCVVTNRIAIVLGIIIVGLFVLDIVIYGSEHMVFLGKKMLDLIEWMAFWR